MCSPGPTQLGASLKRNQLGERGGFPRLKSPHPAQTVRAAFMSPAGHRFEDVPGVRRHLVRKSAKGQVVHLGKESKEPSARQRKQDRQPHEVRRRRTA